jgi:hypothetical protein
VLRLVHVVDRRPTERWAHRTRGDADHRERGADGSRITIQQLRTCQPTFNAALTGSSRRVATTTTSRTTSAHRTVPDHLCRHAAGILAQQLATNRWNEAPDIAEWMTRSRLNAVQTMNDHLGEPRMQDAIGRYLTAIEPAMENLERLLADA